MGVSLTSPESIIPPSCDDELTFYANADQSFYWSDGSTQVLKQKSLGQAIMVSDFLEEVNGFLDFDGERARLMLETQTEGYFTNEMLITQLCKAVTLFEKKYPAAQGLSFSIMLRRI